MPSPALPPPSWPLWPLSYQQLPFPPFSPRNHSYRTGEGMLPIKPFQSVLVGSVSCIYPLNRPLPGSLPPHSQIPSCACLPPFLFSHLSSISYVARSYSPCSQDAHLSQDAARASLSPLLSFYAFNTPRPLLRTDMSVSTYNLYMEI